jgi:hypothetical protein
MLIKLDVDAFHRLQCAARLGYGEARAGGDVCYIRQWAVFEQSDRRVEDG